MLHVRNAGTTTALTGDRLAGAGLVADSLVALDERGPFAPLSRAILADGTLRDRLADVLATPSLRGERRVRWVILALTVLPFVLLLELDRELAMGGSIGPGRIVVDALLAAWTWWELTRRTPRFPRLAALALVAAGGRWTLVATRHCGTSGPLSPLVYVGAVLAFGAAAALAALVPTRERIAQELLGKLGIERAEARAVQADPPPEPALVAAAIGCAAGLPALLWLVRGASTSAVFDAAVFVIYGTAAPILARRFFGREPAPAPVSPRAVLLATAAGLALAAAAATAGHLFFDNGAELARCFHRLGNEAKVARAMESAELARALERVRSSTTLFLMTALVVPFAEERIFRGLLQDVLGRRWGRSYGIFAAAVAFGAAHLGVYEVALYQTVLLGIGFGLAYAEGGIVAAFFVHATWNVIQMA